MSQIRIVLMVPVLVALTGCAGTAKLWDTVSQGMFGGAPGETERAIPPAQGAPIFPLERSVVFGAAVSVAREMGWKLESARRDDPYLVALPVATVFSPREEVFINLLERDRGVEVDLRTESGEDRDDFEEFYARLRERLARH